MKTCEMINIKDELTEIPLRCAELVYNELRNLGYKERQQAADIYEERLSIIAELRIAEHLPPTTKQRLWAWESTLRGFSFADAGIDIETVKEEYE